MERKKLVKKGLAKFDGMSIAKNKVVNLKFKMSYDEIVTSVELLQGLNSDVTVHAKVPNESASNLGIFRIDKLNFDKDGNALLQFKSLTENVNLDRICSLADEEIIQLKFMAVLELPQQDEEDEEGGEEEWQD